MSFGTTKTGTPDKVTENIKKDLAPGGLPKLEEAAKKVLLAQVVSVLGEYPGTAVVRVSASATEGELAGGKKVLVALNLRVDHLAGFDQ